MLARAASPYFSDRARQSWRTLGYGGMATVLLMCLHAPAQVLGLAAVAFAFPSMWNLVESHRERNGDKMPNASSFSAKRQERQDRREFATLPFSGLLGKWEAELSLEDLITEAAYCSNEYGRRLSVICVRTPGLPQDMREFVADLLRAHVRAKDEVEIVSDDEFIVCSHLLRDALAADAIAKRLEGALRGADRLASLPLQLGKAIYPLDGYTGADLISCARGQLRPVAA